MNFFFKTITALKDIQTIGVIGGGTAGYLTALFLNKKFKDTYYRRRISHFPLFL